MAGHRQRPGVARVELHRAHRVLVGLLAERVVDSAAHFHDLQAVPPGQVGMGLGIAGVELNRPAQHLAGRIKGRAAELVHARQAAQHAVVGREVAGRVVLDAGDLGVLQLRVDGRGDAGGDLVLEAEHVLGRAVIALLPDHPVGDRMHQVDADAQLRTGAPHGAGQQVAHAQLGGDLGRVTVMRPVAQGGAVGDHKQRPVQRQRGNHLLGQAVAKVGVEGRPVGLQRQHRDRRLPAPVLVRPGRELVVGVGIGLGLDPEQHHRLQGVLHHALTQWLKPGGQFVACKISHGLGGQHVVMPRNLVDFGRQVDAVADQFAVIHDHVIHTQADAHAQRAARVGGPAVGQAALQAQAPGQRIDHAGKFQQHALRRQLDQAATGRRHAGLDQLGAGGAPGLDRRHRVARHPARPAHHVGLHHGRQPAHHPLGRWGGLGRCRQRCGRRGGTGQRQPVAAAGDGGNGQRPQHLAQRRDLHRQVVLLDHQAGPGQVQQLVLGDHPVAPLDQRQQHVESPRTQRRGGPVHQQQALGRPDLDPAQGDGLQQAQLPPGRWQQASAVSTHHPEPRIYPSLVTWPAGPFRPD